MYANKGKEKKKEREKQAYRKTMFPYSEAEGNISPK